MTLTDWQQEDCEALRAVYSAEQLWSWDEIQMGTTKQGRHVGEWLANCPPPRANPLLLPIQRVGEVEPSWLAIAFSETQCEELREHLIAFVGASGADFSGQRANLDPHDPLDTAVRQWAGGTRVFRFRALENAREQVRRALERLRNVWRIRPRQTASSFRTTEAMLREFHQALLTRDEASALNWLEKLCGGGRLNAENLLFLKIESLAAFERWQDIVFDPQWSMLIQMRRPRRTTALLIEALWRTEFQTLAIEGLASNAIIRMRESILPSYRQLFRTRGSFKTRSVVLAFLLAAAADEPPRSAQVAALLTDIPADAPERAFAEVVAGTVSEQAIPPVADALTLAQQYLSREDYDGAWSHVQLCLPSPAACAVMLKCAGELLNGEVARTVATAFAQCSDAERAALLLRRSNRRIWEDIQAEQAKCSGPVVVDWESWLDAIKTDPSWPGALDAAEASTSDWSIASYRRDPSRTEALAKRFLNTQTEEERNVLRLAFPHLAKFFTAEGQLDPVFHPVLLNLFLMLALDPRFGGEDWTVSENLAISILDAGASASEYSEVVQALTIIWEQRGAVPRLDWALDVLDKLITTPALNTEARASFFDVICQTFHRYARRIDASHVEMFGLLCDDLQRRAEFDSLPIPVQTIKPDEPSGPSLKESLRDKIISIYTLTEAAGLRAKQILERLFDHIDVRLSNDHVGSDRLRAMARESDYFIVATRSAKHAATEFIKSNRPPSKSELIYASGKGSTSLVSSLLATIQESIS